MPISPWLRLWLPLGNVILLITIIETVDLFRNEVKDMGILLYQGLTQNDDDYSLIEAYSTLELAFLLILLTIRFISTIGLLIIGTIVKGHKGCFLAYIIVSITSSLGLGIFLVSNIASAFPHLTAWHRWTLMYPLLLFIVFNTYINFVLIVGYRALGRQEALHPVGKGATFIWEYFSNETKVAATFFLTSEIAMDTEYLLSRQFIQFFGIPLQGHDGDSYPPIVIEEIVLRLIRIVINSIGIWLVTKEQRRIFRWWCAATFFLILVSTAIFIILTVQWRGEDLSITLAYFLMFPGHLLYRFLTLYFCLKYTRADFSSFVL